MLLSLEDELAVLDLRYADLLQCVQSLSGSDEDDVEVHTHCTHLTTSMIMSSRLHNRHQHLLTTSDSLSVWLLTSKQD